MKVIGINGSARKNKNSATMLAHALEGARSKGAETELINLFDLDYKGCISCFACKLIDGKYFGRCAVRDDLQDVLDKILNADGVIFSSPIYFGDVSGSMRNLFERIWFPGLLYKSDGSVAYKKRVKVGLIYTMNVQEAEYYDTMIKAHKSSFERFLGSTLTYCATDTLQFNDYSMYASEVFDEEEKLEVHKNKFPLDLQKAFEMGEQIAK